jgi:HEAT repeat protein
MRWIESRQPWGLLALSLGLLVGCQQHPWRWSGSEIAPSKSASEIAVSDDEPAPSKSPAPSKNSEQAKPSDQTTNPAPTKSPVPPVPLAPDLTTQPLVDRFDKKHLPATAAASSTWDSEAWILAVEDPHSAVESREHWRHHELEAALELPRSEQPRWRESLKSDTLATRAQAAIAMARLGDLQSLPPLVAAVREIKLKLSTRRAAAEALGRLPPAASLDSVTSLVKEYGRFDGEAAARYVPDLHADLLLTWQRLAPADSLQPALDALASPAPNVRRAALRSFLRPSREALPTRVLDLAGDRDALNRGLVLRVLAARRDPRTIDMARQALLDSELSVKLAALRALGDYGGESAVAMLKTMQKDPGEMIRAAALAGLAQCGDLAALETALADKSWRVRSGLAEILCKNSSEQSQKLAARLLADRSSEVRKTTLTSMTQWPWPAAGPLLLSAAENEFPSVRYDAIQQLRSRWSAARELTASASLERIRAQCAELRTQLDQELNRLQKAASPVKLAAWEEHISDELEASAENLARKTKNLLQQQDEAWRRCALRLKEKQTPERRAAIQEFQRVVDGCACERAIWQELQTFLEKEHDTTVWLAALAMFAAQQEPHLAPLLALGASHPSAEVRKQALEWFIANPNPAYGDLLTNSLLDDHVAVIQAALRALAALPDLPNPRAIEELLAARDPAIRLAAAYALAAHGIPPGYAALIRLAYHEEPLIRRQVALLLGELGDIRSISELIRLLDDRPEVQLAGLTALKLLLGQDIAQDPAVQARAGIPARTPTATGNMSMTCNEQCRCWKTWHMQNQARSARQTDIR